MMNDIALELELYMLRPYDDDWPRYDFPTVMAMFREELDKKPGFEQYVRLGVTPVNTIIVMIDKYHLIDMSYAWPNITEALFDSVKEVERLTGLELHLDKLQPEACL